RFGNGGSLATLDGYPALAALRVGISPCRNKPHVRGHHGYHASGVDCCPIASGGADEPHRSRSLAAAMLGRALWGLAVFLECAGGERALTWRTGLAFLTQSYATSLFQMPPPWKCDDIVRYSHA